MKLEGDRFEFGRWESLSSFREINRKIDREIYGGANKIKLDLVLQTHSRADSQSHLRRYCGKSKWEVTLRCFASLVKSLNFTGPHIDARLTVLDDHSDEFCVTALNELLRKLRHPSEFIALETSGLYPSIESCFRFARDKSRGDLVYVIQDDYLFSQTAIEEMVDAIYRFKFMLGGRETAIYPFDDPYRYYAPKNVELTRIVHGPRRHWRQTFFTPTTFLASHKTILNNWDLFTELFKIGPHPFIEDLTINNIWQKRGVFLFNPIPSLALHFQHETERDPYINWRKWWKDAEL